MSAEFQLAQTNGIARLIVHNPGKRNAITRAMWRSLPGLLDEASKARVLVISGAAGHFSAGADISEFAALQADELEARAFLMEMQAAITALACFPGPTIAFVQGSCFGAGVALTLACDMRIADETARFSVPPAKLGLLYPQGDIDRLRALIGPGQTSRLLFTGATINAKEALRIALVDELTDEATIQTMAQIIAGLAPQALRQLKRQIRNTLADPDGAFARTFAEKEFAEGLNAFANKRKPDYS